MVAPSTTDELDTSTPAAAAPDDGSAPPDPSPDAAEPGPEAVAPDGGDADPGAMPADEPPVADEIVAAEVSADEVSAAADEIVAAAAAEVSADADVAVTDITVDARAGAEPDDFSDLAGVDGDVADDLAAPPAALFGEARPVDAFVRAWNKAAREAGEETVEEPELGLHELDLDAELLSHLPPPVAVPTVRIPSAGTGVRARRRRTARRLRQVRGVGALGTAVVLVLGLQAIGRLTDTSDGTPLPLGLAPERLTGAVSSETTVNPAGRAEGGAGEGAGAAAPAEAPASVLVVVAAEDGTAELLAVLAPRAGGGGTVIQIPVGAVVEVPAFGLEPIGRSMEQGGAALAEQAVERLFGVDVGATATVTPAALAAAAGDGLTVSLPSGVELDGAVAVPWSPGRAVVGGDTLAELIAGPEGVREIDLLAHHEQLWSEWTVLAADGALIPDGLPPELVEAARILGGGRITVEPIAVEPLGAIGGEGGDWYRVDAEATADLVARALPAAPAAPSGPITVSVRNGTGVPGLAAKVTDRLGGVGVEVVDVGNASRFDHAKTRILFRDPNDRALAELVRQALGVGEVARGEGVETADVTIVVGFDYVG